MKSFLSFFLITASLFAAEPAVSVPPTTDALRVAYYQAAAERNEVAAAYWKALFESLSAEKHFKDVEAITEKARVALCSNPESVTDKACVSKDK